SDGEYLKALESSYQKLESRSVTLCYSLPRTLQTLNNNLLTQKLEHSLVIVVSAFCLLPSAFCLSLHLLP
ncbi:MAG: hypothetical protein ACFB0E_22630, partial [Leptolyngbyaceae cyanobacterium]